MRRARVVLASALLVVSVSRATCQQTSDIRATAEAAIRAADAAGLKAAQAKDIVLGFHEQSLPPFFFFGVRSRTLAC